MDVKVANGIVEDKLGQAATSFEPTRVEDLTEEHMARWVMDAIRRAIVHYGMWYSEVQHQFGIEAAQRMEAVAGDRGIEIMMDRLGKVLGFEVQNGIPKKLLDMKPNELLDLAKAISVNWLVGDGVWFQAVERDEGMVHAKRCNDSCWGKFSPYEAIRIKELLGLGERPGLEGLAAALQMRLYSRINKQSMYWEPDGSLRFEMNACRVQVARKRKGLDDYPCKSAGLVEYPFFARAIDPRIQTECIGCPPDPHPDTWWCSWRFRIRPDTTDTNEAPSSTDGADRH